MSLSRSARLEKILGAIQNNLAQIPELKDRLKRGGTNLKQVLKELEAHPNAILFIDEIHTLIGAGAASGGTLDASNLLKPALSTGAMKCIGATTFTDYRGIFVKGAALSRRFQKIDFVEPTVEQTIEILKGLKTRFEDHHSVKYALGALQAAATWGIAARRICSRLHIAASSRR